MKLSMGIILGLVLTINTFSNAYAKTISETAYGRKADVTFLEDLVKMDNIESIVRALEKENVQIYKVKVENPTSSKLNFLKAPPVDKYPELAEKMEDITSGSALFCASNEFANSKTNIILIAEDADPMTIIHEFMHHLYETQNHEQTAYLTETQIKYNQMIKRFSFKTRKVMIEKYLLENRKWRDEIKDIIEEYVSTINEGQGQIAAEEVAVEATLLKLFVENNGPLFNFTRSSQGINMYAQGLTIMTESLVANIYALNDLIVTDGINQDSDQTEEESKLEVIKWTERRAVVEKQLADYLNGPLANIKKQVKESQALLKLQKDK